MMDTTTYVYCVVHRGRAPVVRAMPAGVPGGSRPALLPIAPRLWLLASEVPRRDYAPESIDVRLRDLDWVSRIALAHEAAVERMIRIRGTTAIPMKLFTMFSGPELAIAEMRARRPQLDRILKQIAGCDEWGVRITRGAPAPSAVRPAAGRSGAAFLDAKRQARDAARERLERMALAAEEALVSLGHIAKATRQRSAPDGATSPPLLDAAFLVPVRRKARFRAAVKKAAARCRAAGAELTLTGPWPAYNFINGGEAHP